MKTKNVIGAILILGGLGYGAYYFYQNNKSDVPASYTESVLEPTTPNPDKVNLTVTPRIPLFDKNKKTYAGLPVDTNIFGKPKITSMSLADGTKTNAYTVTSNQSGIKHNVPTDEKITVGQIFGNSSKLDEYVRSKVGTSAKVQNVVANSNDKTVLKSNNNNSVAPINSSNKTVVPTSAKSVLSTSLKNVSNSTSIGKTGGAIKSLLTKK